MCQKEIIYLNLLKDETKSACVGFLKYQKKDSQYQVEIQVKNVTVAMSGSFPIRIQTETGWQEIGMLILKEGSGRWTGILSEVVLRAEIMLLDTYKVKGQSKNAEKPVEESARTAEDKVAAENAAISRQRENNAEHTAVEGNIADNAAVNKKMADDAAVSNKAIDSAAANEETMNDTASDISNPTVYKTMAEKPAPVTKMPERTLVETVMRAESMPVAQKRISAPRIAVQKGHSPLYENKWEQLLATYEQIHPYADNRVYVKLEPKDFIVLRENYQHLVNNSFLLHGFYNYRYLILGKEQDFYLGVPGVFYEREKMVALMFGFEAFECEGGEAEEGKFGYYLRKVEL